MPHAEQVAEALRSVPQPVAGEPEASPDVLDVGGSVRPDITSQGLGTAVFPAILDFARERFRPATFRTAVAAFNEPSLRRCRTAGFAGRVALPGRTGAIVGMRRNAAT